MVDIFDSIDDGEELQEPVANAVTIFTPSGGQFFVHIEEPTALEDILASAQLDPPANSVFVVDGTAVGRDYVLGPGATLTMATLQKAG